MYTHPKRLTGIAKVVWKYLRYINPNNGTLTNGVSRNEKEKKNRNQQASPLKEKGTSH